VSSLPFSRALVTGAAGFVGANVVDALQAAGVEVHGLVRPSSNRWRLDAIGRSAIIHTVDLREQIPLNDLVDRIRPDVVFHAAASSVHHPVSATGRATTLADTVPVTANLCEALAQSTVRRLVYLGSSLEYGRSDDPVAETSRLRPATFRGASKAAATLLCAQMAAEAGIDAVLLRPFSVYGPWEAASRFVPSVMAALATGSDISLTGPGIARDFVFIADVVDACLRAAASERASGEILNIGTGVGTTNETLVECAQRVAGVRVRVRMGEYPERRVDSTVVIADISKARMLLGWQPVHSLEQGLAETWRWTTRPAAAAAGR
jgi:nucleoside-diphosphate-sugar epimerase